MSRAVTFAEIGHDGKLVTKEVMVADSEWGEDAEDRAADYPPTEEEWARFKPVPRIRSLRRALSLSLEDFSERYFIPIETLRDWEEGRSKPDRTAQAYLKVIASDPDGVAKTLSARPAA